MKQKIDDQELATKKDVTNLDHKVENLDNKVEKIDSKVESLQKDLKTNYPTKKDLSTTVDVLLKYIDVKINSVKDEIDEKAREYRDQLMTKLDYIVGELADIREDRILGDHQTKKLTQKVDNHEKRLVKLEFKRTN